MPMRRKQWFCYPLVLVLVLMASSCGKKYTSRDNIVVLNSVVKCQLSDPNCTRGVGDFCSRDRNYCQRDLGASGLCLGLEGNTKTKFGMCAIKNCDGNCPIGSVCVSRDSGSFCLPLCNDDSNCRDDQKCYTVLNDGRNALEVNICLPKEVDTCNNDSDCVQGQVCDVNPYLLGGPKKKHCYHRSRGTKDYGEVCDSSAECQGELRARCDEPEGSYRGYCTLSCAKDDDCSALVNNLGHVYCHESVCIVGCQSNHDCRALGEGVYVCNNLNRCIMERFSYISTGKPCDSDGDCEEGETCGAENECLREREN